MAMTTPGHEPQDPAPRPPALAGERETLVGFIEFLRSGIEAKTAGFDDAELRRTLGPSTMTLGGMLTHLACVEDYWFTYLVAGADEPEPWASAPWHEDADWDWALIERVSGDEARRIWRDAVERSRAVLARAASLDDVSARAAGDGRDGEDAHVSLRFVLVHVVAEYARHAGHADLLAESMDGRTGE